jgi:spore maturation protein CgeB
MDGSVLPRVLVVGSRMAADSMEWHVVDSLRHMNAPVEFFDCQSHFNALPTLVAKTLRKTATLLLREPERLLERQLLNAVDRFEPSLVLVLLGNQLSPKTLDRMRARTSAPVVCWCQDQMTTLGRQFLIGAGYDMVFLKDRYLLDLFSRMIRSTTFRYLPEACNPRVHKTVTLTDADREKFGCDVMIAGTLYYYRQEILRQLGRFKLKVWGEVPGWLQSRLAGAQAGKSIVLNDKAKAAAAARVSLNTLHFAEIDGLNCRAFELAGCGAFQFVTSVPVLREHFLPGEEIIAFASIEELIDGIEYYLKRPEMARGIAKRGQERAYREHTYERRLGEILSVAGMTSRSAG